jgi:hypothetical protein
VDDFILRHLAEREGMTLRQVREGTRRDSCVCPPAPSARLHAIRDEHDASSP